MNPVKTNKQPLRTLTARELATVVGGSNISLHERPAPKPNWGGRGEAPKAEWGGRGL